MTLEGTRKQPTEDRKADHRRNKPQEAEQDDADFDFEAALEELKRRSPAGI